MAMTVKPRNCACGQPANTTGSCRECWAKEVAARTEALQRQYPESGVRRPGLRDRRYGGYG